MESNRPSGRHDWMSVALCAFKNGDSAQKMAVCDDITMRFRSGATLHNNQPSAVEAITCIGEGLRTQSDKPLRIKCVECVSAIGVANYHQLGTILKALVNSYVSAESVQEKDFYMRLLGATLITRERNLWIAKNVSKLFGSLKTICLTPNQGPLAMPMVGHILMQLFRSYNQSCSNFLNSCLESALVTLNFQENDEMMFQRCVNKALERADFSLFTELPIGLTALTICLEMSAANGSMAPSKTSGKRYDGRLKTFCLLQQLYVTLSDYLLYHLRLDTLKNTDVHELTFTAHYIIEEDVHCFREVYPSMNSCLQWARVRLGLLVENKTEYDPELVSYAVQLCSIALTTRRFVSEEALCLCLLALAKAVAGSPEEDSKFAIGKIAGTDGMILQLCHDRSKFVSTYAFRIIAALFYGKSETHIAEVGNFIIGEVKALVAVLEDYFPRSNADGMPIDEAVQFGDGGLCTLSQTKIQLLDFIIICKQLIADHSLNTKALSSFFLSLVNCVPVCSPWLSIYFPDVQYSIVAFASYFFRRHACLLDHPDPRRTCSAKGISGGGDRLEKVMKLYAEVLKSPYVSLNIRNLIYNCMERIISAHCSDNCAGMIPSNGFVALLLSAFTYHDDMIKCDGLLKLMHNILTKEKISLPEAVHRKFAETCIWLSARTLSKHWFNSLQMLLPLFSYKLSFPRQELADAQNKLRSVPKIKHMLAFSSGLASYMKFIALEERWPLNFEGEVTRLASYFSEIPGTLTIKNEYIATLMRYPGTSLHFANVTLAQLLVEDELACFDYGHPHSLGGVQEALRRLVRPRNSNAESVRVCAPNFHERWARSHLLLPFIRQLAKHVYNACVGTAFAFSSTTGDARKDFYEINGAYCDASLGLIQPLAVACAVQYGEYATAVEFASQLCLKETLLFKGRLQAKRCILFCVTNALSEIGASSSIEGICSMLTEDLEGMSSLCKISSFKAAECYEGAASLYANFVSDQLSGGIFTNPDCSSLLRYCIDEMVDCYLSVNDVDAALEWLNKMSQLSPALNVERPSIAQYAEIMKSLGSFAEPAYDLFSLERDPRRYEDYLRICDCHISLFAGRTNVGGRSSLQRKLSNDLADKRYLYSAIFKPLELKRDLELRSDLLKLCKQTASNKVSTPATNINVEDFTIKQLTLIYSILLSTGQLEHGHDLCFPDFCTEFSRRARKTGNTNLAFRVLNSHFNCSDTTQVIDHLASSEGASIAKLSCGYEYAKALYQYGERSAAFSLVYRMICQSVELLELPESLFGHDLAERGALASADVASDYRRYMNKLSRSLILLSRWMTEHSSFGDILLAGGSPAFIRYLEDELQSIESYAGTMTSDCVIGAMLQLSTRLDPEFVKGHIQFAEWLSNYSTSVVCKNDERELLRLSPEDELFVNSCLPTNIDAWRRNEIMSLALAVRTEFNNISADSLHHALSKIECFNGMDALVQFWSHRHKLLLCLYEQTLYECFQILKLSPKDEFHLVEAQLQIIDLLAKHFSDLFPSVQRELHEMDTKHWKNVIPQLFAHLNHPNKFAQAEFTKILCSLAESTPESVLFPTIVRLHKKSTGFYLEEGHLECCKKVAAVLRNNNPTLVNDTIVFITEMHRIMLLREEIWLALISYVELDATKRLRVLNDFLRSPAVKAPNYPGRSKQKKIRVVKELLFRIIRQVYEITTAPPETKNEEEFNAVVAPLLVKLIKAIKHNSFLNILQLLTMLRQLHRTLSTRGARQENLSLKIEDISPNLASLRNTEIPIPDVRHGGRPVTLRCVDCKASVLQTKTKPKRLCFVGSNGLRYFYLLKGAEDLNLDQRVMQFINVCNGLFASRIREKRRELYYCRSYSVTPLGPRCGLIGLVENCVPAFSVYKKWLTRQKKLNGKDVSVRPNDIFLAKLFQLLEEENIGDFRNRTKWPSRLLKQVLLELISETPRTLLSKEFWCTHTHAEDWWEVQTTFIRSAAAASMVGYIVGLGDRHLDNLLINFDTGEMVNIDYNLCFDKGKHLRVPETVPFRLTQNIESALGIGGVQGEFQKSCVNLIAALRSKSTTLLKLFDAFIYEPLIDWTAGYPGGTHGTVIQNIIYALHPSSLSLREYKEGDFQLRRQLFCLYCRELLVQWDCYNEQLRSAVQAYIDSVAKITAIETELEEIEKELQLLGDRKLYLAEAKGNRNHPVFTVAERFSQFRSFEAKFAQLLAHLKNTFQCYDHLMGSYETAVSAISPWETFKSGVEEVFVFSPSSIDLAKEFYKTTVQLQKLRTCDKLKNSLLTTYENLRQLFAGAVELLPAYVELQRYMPVEFRNSYYLRKWLRLINDAIEVKSTSDVEKVEMECNKLLNENPLRIKDVTALGEAQKACHDVEAAVSIVSERSGKLSSTDLSLPSLEVALGQIYSAGSDFQALHITRLVREKLFHVLEKVVEFNERLHSASSSSQFDPDFELNGMVFVMKHMKAAQHFLAMTGSDSANPTIALLQRFEKVFDQLLALIRGLISGVVPELFGVAAVDRGAIMKLLDLLTHFNSSSSVTWDSLRDDLIVSKVVVCLRNPLYISTLRDLQNRASCLLQENFPEGLKPIQSAVKQTSDQYAMLEAAIVAVLSLITEVDRSEPSSSQVKDGSGIFVPTAADSTFHSALFLCRYYATYLAFSGVLACSDFLRGFNSPDSLAGVFIQFPKLVVAALLKQILYALVSHVLNMVVSKLEEPSVPGSETEASCGTFKKLEELYSNTLFKWDLRLKQQVALVFTEGSSVVRTVTNVFRWFNSEVDSSERVVRSELLLDLRKLEQSLGEVVRSLQGSLESLSQFSGEMFSRLKWAAGANKVWSSHLESFNDAVIMDKQKIEVTMNTCRQLGVYLNAIVSLETLPREADGILSGNAETVRLVMNYLEASSVLNFECSKLSQLELSLLNVLPACMENSNGDWIVSLLAKADQEIEKAGIKREQTIMHFNEALKRTDAHLNSVRTEFSNFFERTAETSSIVKNFAKIEEDGLFGQLHDFFRLCRFHAETAVSIIRSGQLLHNNISVWSKEILSSAKVFEETNSLIRETLCDFSDPKKFYDVEGKRDRFAKFLNGLEQWASSDASHVERKFLGTRSAQGISVCNNVKRKLQGIDQSGTEELPVALQVNNLLEQARNIDNLALMYEGWTAWV